MTASEVFHQNDGKVTKAFYVRLDALGPLGKIATALFRCQKRSSIAKKYRGGRYRRAAYDVKNWSLGELCKLLAAHGEDLGIVWGWREDPHQEYHNQVLYVETSQGQCSFHSAERLEGPDYPGDWDGKHASEDRIIRFADEVLAGLQSCTKAVCAQGETVVQSAKENSYGTINGTGIRTDRIFVQCSLF